MTLGEVISAAGAIALIIEVGDDAHVTEAVAAGRQEGILENPHADGAEQVPVALGIRLHRRAVPRSVRYRLPLCGRSPGHVRGLR